MLQNSLNTTRHNGDYDDNEDDDHGKDAWVRWRDQCVKCFTVQRRVRHDEQWIRHVGQTQADDSESTSTTWMATLLDSLHFRLVDHEDVPLQSHPRLPPPSQSLVYVLDSDVQPAALTFGSCFKPETAGRDRSASVVSQSKSEVESPTLRTLPDLTSSSSLSTVGNSSRRLNPRDHVDVTSASTSSPPKPNSVQSPPLAARYPLRRKIQTVGSSTTRGVDETARPSTATAAPPPPPLPARRGNLPPTPRFRAHLESPMTSLAGTEPASELPVEPSGGERQQASETTHDECDDNDDYSVDVCGTSMLEYVLQAANSLSPSHDVTDDVTQQQQQQVNNDNNNIDNDRVTPSTAGINSLVVTSVSSNNNFEVLSVVSRCIRSKP